jgi:hypothetical protein
MKTIGVLLVLVLRDAGVPAKDDLAYCPED